MVEKVNTQCLSYSSISKSFLIGTSMGYMIMIPPSGHSGKGKNMRTGKRLVAARGEGWRKGLNKKNKYGETPLIKACENGNEAIGSRGNSRG